MLLMLMYVSRMMLAARTLQIINLIIMDIRTAADVQLGGGGRLCCLVLICAPPLLPLLRHSAHHKDSMYIKIQCIL